MKVISDPYNKNQVRSRTTPLSPYQVYLEQIRSVSDSIRATSRSLTYYPLQFGGLKGQREAITAVAVVDILDFQSKGNTE